MTTITKTESIINARIVYRLETPRLFGLVYQIDRVIVEYTNDSEEDEPYYDITIKGWRLTGKATVDKRQTVRDTVYLPWEERVEFLKEDLGINYMADVRSLLDAPAGA